MCSRLTGGCGSRGHCARSTGLPASPARRSTAVGPSPRRSGPGGPASPTLFGKGQAAASHWVYGNHQPLLPEPFQYLVEPGVPHSHQLPQVGRCHPGPVGQQVQGALLGGLEYGREQVAGNAPLRVVKGNVRGKEYAASRRLGGQFPTGPHVAQDFSRLSGTGAEGVRQTCPATSPRAASPSSARKPNRGRESRARLDWRSRTSSGVSSSTAPGCASLDSRQSRLAKVARSAVLPWRTTAMQRPSARSLAGNPDSPQAVVFLTSIIDVTVGY